MRLALTLVVGYLVLVLIGLIPVNNDFQTCREPDGVTIYVVSNPVHADLILPMVTEEQDWRTEFPASDFASGRNDWSHISIGWGDRGFYLETPEWKDLKLSTTANALLWPSRTVMHVQGATKPTGAGARAVCISPRAYRELVEFISASFAAERGSRPTLGHAYNRWDAFYEARGRYHVFNTCNCWVGRALKTSGVRVPWFAPLPKTVLWYLPKSDNRSAQRS